MLFQIFLKLIKKYLKEKFISHQNKNKRQWYFKTFTKETTISYLENWYDHHMNKIKTNIPFFTWFVTYSQENEIDYPYKNESINTSSTL